MKTKSDSSSTTAECQDYFSENNIEEASGKEVGRKDEVEDNLNLLLLLIQAKPWLSSLAV